MSDYPSKAELAAMNDGTIRTLLSVLSLTDTIEPTHQFAIDLRREQSKRTAKQATKQAVHTAH